MTLPEELQGLEAEFRKEVEANVGPTCSISKCKVRVLKRESDGDIKLTFTHYCGRTGNLTVLP